ncbi:MAG: ABC transporter ATP-binding protein/permease [Oscillospiraceae bacterium]|nr:ABC transporter ATP-binding protein/permease [Oscillospiraceae bacterium]
MLKLKDIRKNYPAGDGEVEALKGINLEFRQSEFVSILGPSGCGKTTMLNIIGGLDNYTSGDLIINGRSTKNFKYRDWDGYRNHSVGFVFQSYNLIPHQTVLENVELALTLSGVSKKERKKRAKEALEKVGLGNQLNKRPNQMSGGQMQRVAIARAIVNDPEIILADEPTGALDTQTSVQVMDILKEISKDRLVIMVTHNPELAEEYSDRIVKVLDGKVLSDSNPLDKNETAIEQSFEKTRNKLYYKDKKPSMNLWTSFGLSMRNLLSKKGRTALTSFAGSIGIIGIALIYAVSQGMTTYINALQEETLSSYPLTVQAETMDVGSLMTTFIGSAESSGEHEKDAVYEKNMVYNLVNALGETETIENDLESFKNFIESELDDETSTLYGAVNGVQYTYDLDMLVYTENVDGTIIRADSQALMQELLMEYFGADISGMMNMRDSMSGMENMMSMTSGGSSVVLFQEILSGENGSLVNPAVENQYDLVYGSWPSDYNDMILVVDENNEIDDMTLYALGLKSKEDIDALVDAAINKTTLEAESRKWSFEEICDMKFRVVFGSDCYTFDESTGLYTDMRDTEAGLKYLYDNGTDLEICGIIRPKEDSVSQMLTGTLCYTSELTEYVIENSKNSDSIKAQLENPEKDIFTGLPFEENTGNLDAEEKTKEFKKYLSMLSEEEKAADYIKIKSIPSEEALEMMLAQAMEGVTREGIEEVMLAAVSAQTGMSTGDMADYISAMSDEELTGLYKEMAVQQIRAQYAAEVEAQLAPVPTAQLAAMLDEEAENYTAEQCAKYYDEVLEFSASSYEQNLLELGYLDIDKPASINLYASTFESKDVIEDAISEYNEGVDELSQISYTDYVGIMMSSITTIINAITYVLIAFVAVSLVVSSIMIGVITLISVQERTKEIGVLRAIGASKKNVSTLFNAETIIIGFTSGALGVIITQLLCYPINAVLQHFTGIANLKAFLPWEMAFVLIAISVMLNMLAGIIPSRSAAKKDPVVALRSE